MPTRTDVYAEVQAPGSWRNSQWQKAGIAPVRFDKDAKALVLVKEGANKVTVAVAREKGVVDVPVLEFVTSGNDFVATDKTKNVKVDVPDDED